MPAKTGVLDFSQTSSSNIPLKRTEKPTASTGVLDFGEPMQKQAAPAVAPKKKEYAVNKDKVRNVTMAAHSQPGLGYQVKGDRESVVGLQGTHPIRSRAEIAADRKERMLMLAQGARGAAMVGGAALSIPASLPVGIGLSAGLAGAGELTAQSIEDIAKDEETTSLWDKLKASGKVAGVDAALGTLTAGMLAGGGKIFSKMFRPKSIPEAVRTTQKVLRTAEEQKIQKSYLKDAGRYVRSQSIHEFSPEKKTLAARTVTWLRSQGYSKAFDDIRLNNLDTVKEMYDGWVKENTRNMSASEIGAFFERQIGLSGDFTKGYTGEIMNPAVVHADALYDSFRGLLGQIPEQAKEIDVSGFIPVFNKIGKSHPDINLIAKAMELEGKMPSLKAKGAWKYMLADDVDDMIHAFNQAWKANPNLKSANTQLKMIQKQLKEPLEAYLNKNPVLKEAHQAAQNFYAKGASLLEKHAVKTLQNTMRQNPEAVAELLNPATGNPAAKLGKFKQIKELMKFGANVPGGIGQKSLETALDNTYRMPMRYAMIQQATEGTVFKPAKMLNIMEKAYEKKGAPELMHEVFGGKKNYNEFKDIMVAMKQLETLDKTERTFVNIRKVAYSLGGTATLYSIFTQDNPMKTAGYVGAGVGIALSPIVLAKAMANPKLGKLVYEGVANNGTMRGNIAKSALALRKIAGMKICENFMGEHTEQKADTFYSQQVVEE
jgi:hypothetical protein